MTKRPVVTYINYRSILWTTIQTIACNDPYTERFVLSEVRMNNMFNVAQALSGHLVVFCRW